MCSKKMYNQNSDHKSAPPPMSPRISFSNDFVANHHRANAYRDAPVSSDFEFSVTNYSMMTADELFFKGRLLPLKESPRTLREELKDDDDDDDGDNDDDGTGSFSLRPPKNPTRWRGFLGLRKGGSKKSDKSVEKRTSFHHDDVQCSKNSSQDYVD